MNKIVLIGLPIQSYSQKDFAELHDYNPALGLISIGTWLELNGYEPVIIDLCFNRIKLERLLSIIREADPILVGICAYTENINMAANLAKVLKENFSTLKVAVGGPHPSLVPEDAILSEHIDFAVRKEGESAMLELVMAVSTCEQAIRYDDIPGLVFKRDGEIIKNQMRPAISDLDIMPIPKRELGDIEKYKGDISISTSRGCPANCIYCAATALSGATYRMRDIRNVYMEMVLIKTYMKDSHSKIHIIDDTFTADPRRIFEFTSIVERYGLKLLWSCESRVDVMTEELISKMASAGCVAIQYGIESGCQQVLDRISKKIDLDTAEKVIGYTCKNKILPILSFILGHYCDTKETMGMTVDFIKKLFLKYKPEIAMAYNTPFPGTWQHTHRQKLGLKLATENYKAYSLLDPIVETDNFTLNDQREFFVKALPYIAYYSSYTMYERKVLKDGK